MRYNEIRSHCDSLLWRFRTKLNHIDMGFRSYVICITLLCAIWPAQADYPCIPKSFGSDSIVCVCNSTNCDTIRKIVPLAAGKYLHYTSNRAGLRFKKNTGSFKKRKKSAYADRYLIEVIPSTTYQTVMGFGAAFTDAAGINIKSLSPGAQENLLRSYWSTEGLEYKFGRVPIAGCDFSTYAYTYDDVDYDPQLKSFNLTKEDFEYKIPIIHRAIKMSEKQIHLTAAAWTSPQWMKTNPHSRSGFMKHEYYEQWAHYHIKFLDEYKKEGLEFGSISTGNQPESGMFSNIEFKTLSWTPNSQFKWVRENFGPALRNSQHKKTKILTMDGQRFELPWWFKNLKNDHVAAGYIDGFAVHWYRDGNYSPSLVDDTHNSFPNKFILGTEAAAGTKAPVAEKVILGSWSRGEMYMQNIVQNLNHWYVGWIDWNMALDTTGKPNWAESFVDAAIIVNSDADEFYKQPMYYALGHFSKFLPEGSVRIQLKAKLSNAIDSIAFKTPEDVIVIVLSNSDEKDTPVTIRDARRGVVNIVLRAHSFQTIIYK